MMEPDKKENIQILTKEFGSLSEWHDSYAMYKLVEFGNKQCRLKLQEIREIMNTVIEIHK